MGALIYLFLLLNSSQAEQENSVVRYQNIEIRAEGIEKQEVLRWLGLVDSTEVGRGLIDDITTNPSNNKVVIYHSPESLRVAGRVLFPAKFSLVTGEIGVDAELFLHFFMPEQGAHEVLECSGGRIPFTLLENFVHELRHARDAVTGQARMHRLERDALESENALREELGKDVQRCLSRDENHIWQVWFDN